MANRIKQLRQQRKITLQQLSDKTDISISSLSAYENNKRSPKIENWLKLADFFDVPVAYLQGVSNYTKDDKKEIDRLAPSLYDKDGNLNWDVADRIWDIDAALSLDGSIKQNLKVANQLIDILFSKLPEKEVYKKYKDVIANSKISPNGDDLPEPLSTYMGTLAIVSEMFFSAQLGDDFAKRCMKKIEDIYFYEYDPHMVEIGHKKLMKEKKLKKDGNKKS